MVKMYIKRLEPKQNKHQWLITTNKYSIKLSANANSISSKWMCVFNQQSFSWSSDVDGAIDSESKSSQDATHMARQQLSQLTLNYWPQIYNRCRLLESLVPSSPVVCSRWQSYEVSDTTIILFRDFNNLPPLLTTTHRKKNKFQRLQSIQLVHCDTTTLLRS